MYFDVPKVVRSPGCDHEHDEESRNGRDMNIDILEAYVWMSEVFWVKSGFYRSTGRLPETPRDLMGLSGPCGEEERRPGQGRAPLPLVRIGQGEGGGAPLPSFSCTPSPQVLIQLGKRRGVLQPVGVGLLLRTSSYGRPHLPFEPLDTEAGSTPRHTS